MQPFVRRILPSALRALVLLLAWAPCACAQNQQTAVWKPVPFAILKFNDAPPKSWNIYHTERHGVVLVRVWKRYLLIDIEDEEVYDIDPKALKPQGQDLTLTVDGVPDNPIEISEWRERDIGPMQRIQFRFGKDGHFLELQLPLKPNGEPLY
jgi:hypothetical protein